jgi:hypothetical protein
MILIPGIIPYDPNLADWNIFDLGTTAVDRNGQPLPASGCLDLIAVAPTALIVLHIVIKYKEIGAADLIKIPPPGNVGWLEDDSVHFSAIS